MALGPRKQSGIIPFPRGGSSDGLPPGGDGPHDPGMEIRVAALESGFADLKASLSRIESAQLDSTKEFNALRRDLKETDLPAIRSQLSAIEGTLKDKPSGRDYLALATSINATLMKAFGLAVTLVVLLVAAAIWLHSQGIF